MKQILEESDMHIPYEEDACYRIEQSPLVAKLKGVKIVEFVQVTGKRRISLLEAKTTAPRRDNPGDYDKYKRDICEKFQNSILLINAAKIGRREDIFSELPQKLQVADYKSASYHLILVIKNSRIEWLPDLTADLRSQVHPFLKCWNIPTTNFIVLNEQLAKERGIVE